MSECGDASATTPRGGRCTECIAVCVDVVRGRSVPDGWLINAIQIIQNEPAMSHFGSVVWSNWIDRQ